MIEDWGRMISSFCDFNHTLEEEGVSFISYSITEIELVICNTAHYG